MAAKNASRNGRIGTTAEEPPDLEVAQDEDGEEVITSAVYRPEIITFKIIGISPLLQNNPAELVGKSGDEDGALSTKKKKYDDAEEARIRVYLDSEGRFCHPTASFLKSMVRAVTGKKFNKVAAPGLIKGNVFAVEDLTPLEDEKGKPLTKYEVSKMSVVIPSSKTRIVRCRPMWPKWCLRVALEINTAIMTTEHVISALTLAGPTVGIGDFRPEKGGRFGRYRVG